MVCEKCDAIKCELGSEPTPAQYIANLIAVFDEVKRVLHPTGLCFVNIGDSYSGSGKGGHSATGIVRDQERRQGFDGTKRWAGSGLNHGAGIAAGQKTLSLDPGRAADTSGIPPKNLLLIPERFAIAMQEAGWIVRSRIAWCKKSAMPESVQDRPTSAWEHLWMFSKSPRYFYDGEAVKELQSEGTHARFGRANSAKPLMLPKSHEPGQGIKANTSFHAATAQALLPDGRRNLRNYWFLGPEPSKLNHYASYPTELVRRCILAGTSARGQCPACGAPWRRVVERGELVKVNPDNGNVRPYDQGKDFQTTQTRSSGLTAGGHIPGHAYELTTLGWQPGCEHGLDPVPQVVLDPFGGSGTTGLVADRLGRDAILVELNPEYARMAERRIAEDAGTLFGETVEVEEARQVGLFEALA